jgi:DNA polymerase I-like protein with 3'-5' exonuclease and polymerase domains
LLKRPADLSWSDEDLLAYFKEIKRTEAYTYDQAKRTVHGNGYGMTPKGMWMMFPHLYASESAAKRVQDIYFTCAPAVPRFQNAVQLRAHEQGYVGGPMDRRCTSILDDPNAHPYGYRHEFYDVVALQPVGPEAIKRLEQQRIPIVYLHERPYVAKKSGDAKRCLAFYPQSTAAGNLKEVAIALFGEPDGHSYIGDAYYGKTPLRAPIHDSLLLEVPDRQLDVVLECAFREMLRPIEEQPVYPEWGIGPYLTIGVEAKVGKNWEEMEKIPTPLPSALGLDILHYVPETLAGDRTYFPATEEEEEDVLDLGIVVQ